MDRGGAPADGATTYVYADVPNRLVGIAIDAVLLSLLVFIGAVALSAAFGPVVRFDLDAYTASVDERLAVANAVLSLALGSVYFVGSYLLLRASPGHLMLTMSLRPLEPAERLSLASAVVRWLLLAAPFGLASVVTTIAAGVADLVAAVVVAAWYVVLLVTTARHPAKQGLHDRLARTIVVKRARAVATRAPLAGD
jgi:hypothetical protein